MNNRSELLPFSVIIPAAGNSVRMGSDKAMLMHINGETFASRMVQNYSSFGAMPVVLIVNNQFAQEDLKSKRLIHVLNEHVDFGRSYSIFIGIKQVPQDFACFIQNIDNPFFETALLERMLEQSENDGFVLPVYNGRGGHPVLLGKNVVSYIQGLNEMTDFRDVLKKFKRITLPYENERILWNINTPGEYERFLITG
jgi:molybdenum cofactor cytidylyltransferase